MQCYETCGSNFVGQLGENVLVLLPNIESELHCKEKCVEYQAVPASSRGNCSVYTYFDASDSQFHEDCVLQTQLVPPVQECAHCVTGVPDCSQQCGLELGGEVTSAIMVTDTSEAQSVTVTGAWHRVN